MKHYYNSSGEFIAYKPSWDSKYVFDSDGHLLGWLPFNEDDVYSEDGRYFATIHDDRLYRLKSEPYHGTPGYMPRPPYVSRPNYQAPASWATLPYNASDIT